MIRTIEVKENDTFEACCNCVNFNDSIIICKMRGCTHAILDTDIKECYMPKESEGAKE